ncbi:MAG: hypothetical protein ACPLVD_09030 [Dictyoglomus turgidum]|uniref:hypothetical protein n=1 Tax=Dictyoglomus turgidum TaxID=513050 RepID=UPI003C7782B7
MVLEVMKALGFRARLNEEGAYLLLTFGFMLEDYTLIDSVKKLTPGSILKLDYTTISIINYYRLYNTPYVNASIDKIISELDYRFKYAV